MFGQPQLTSLSASYILEWTKSSIRPLSQDLKANPIPARTRLISFNDKIICFGGVKVAEGKKSLFQGSQTQPNLMVEAIQIDLSNQAEDGYLTNAWYIRHLGRFGHTACLYKTNKVVISGGIRDTRGAFDVKIKSQALGDIGLLEIGEKGIRSMGFISARGFENEESRGKLYHISHVYNDHMYTFGGLSGKTGEPTNFVFKLNLDTYNWEMVDAVGERPCERFGHCSVLVKDKIYVYGGSRFIQNRETQTFGDLFVFDITHSSWKRIENTLDFSLLWPSMHEIGSKLFIFGVLDAKNSPIAVISYDIENGKWERIITKNAPKPEWQPETVLVGGKVWMVGQDNESAIYSLDMNPVVGKLGTSSVTTMGVSSKGNDEEYVNQLKQMFLDKSYSDVTFVVEGQDIPAHKNILAVRCKFFHNMFSSGMVESQASKITISDIRLPTFKSLLGYIYSNQIELSQDLALDLLAVCDKYSFSELKEVCERYLSQALSVENYVSVANASERFECEGLKDDVVKFVIASREKIKQTEEEARKLSKDLLWEVIFKIGKK